MTSTGTYVTNGVCTGIPANAVYSNSGSSYTLVNAPYGVTLNAYYSATPLASTCQYACASGYSWNGTACLVSSVSGACTAIPANAVYYNGTASYSLVGAAVGTSLTAGYVAGSITTNTCQFNCSSGYSWNGSSCVANSITVVCSGTNVTQTAHKCVFDYAGAAQTLSVTVTGAGGTLTATAWGAGGGGAGDSYYGGGGAAGRLSIPVSTNTTFSMYVGGNNNSYNNAGGATYIMNGSVPFVVAGGGGGSVYGGGPGGAGIGWAGGSTSGGSAAGCGGGGGGFTSAGATGGNGAAGGGAGP